MSGFKSPLEATFGIRVNQLLETDVDYFKYHRKLNDKLRKLRHHCGLINKDTRNFAKKNKYGSITSDDYDKQKLVGILFLLHCERDLAMTEMFKIRASQRGKAKRAEKKLMGTRLKRAVFHADKLIELTKNESRWATRVQYLIFAKLTHAEYYLYGKQAKRKNSEKISSNLALALAALKYLESKNLVSPILADFIQTKYEINLKQHSENIYSSADFHNYITKKVETCRDNGDDELSKLLFDNGYIVSYQKIEEKELSDRIQWRSFNAQIKDAEIAMLVASAVSETGKDLKDYDSLNAKWQDILSKQEKHIAGKVEQDYMEDDEFARENDQIVLAYIKYNSFLTSILRDNVYFVRLMKQWHTSGSSKSYKLAKYKEIEKITNNLVRVLELITEVPGVYSDQELLSQLELCKTYFQSKLYCDCLSELYQTKGRYLEALALNVQSLNNLEENLQNIDEDSEFCLPEFLLSKEKVSTLKQTIEMKWESFIALAEYESLQKNKELPLTSKLNYTLIERLSDKKPVQAHNVQLKNLFPMRPIIRPVSSKPTLFDLAFNYMSYKNTSTSKEAVDESEAQDIGEPISSVESDKSEKSKRGFMSLFGR